MMVARSVAFTLLGVALGVSTPGWFSSVVAAEKPAAESKEGSSQESSGIEKKDGEKIPEPPPKPRKTTAAEREEERRQEILKKYDKDGDGKLNEAERKAQREDYLRSKNVEYLPNGKKIESTEKSESDSKESKSAETGKFGTPSREPRSTKSGQSYGGTSGGTFGRSTGTGFGSAGAANRFGSNNGPGGNAAGGSVTNPSGSESKPSGTSAGTSEAKNLATPDKADRKPEESTVVISVDPPTDLPTGDSPTPKVGSDIPRPPGSTGNAPPETPQKSEVISRESVFGGSSTPPIKKRRR